MLVKKEMKPFMVDNLRQFLERENILFPEKDEELYLQLISYVVVRTTQTGRPVFEAAGSAMDHAHDALMLALLAITQNYGELSKVSYATNTETFSNAFFMPNKKTVAEEEPESKIMITGRGSAIKPSGFSKKKKSTRISRRMF
jgi:replicative DNA helicase